MLLTRKNLLKRITLALILAFFSVQRLQEAHDASAAALSVDFFSLRDHITSKYWLPDAPVRFYNGTHIDTRYRRIRSLKRGLQGRVDIYEDTASNTTTQVVVKTIAVASPNRLPLALHAPFAEWTSIWPSEIGVSLALARHADGSLPDMVDMQDYFILHDLTCAHDQWHWAEVTEFISNGTIVNLAHRLRQTSHTVEEVDVAYRGSFMQLVADLQSLHSAGFCHDDVKPANIFVRTSEHWMLGDLGNVRNIRHPWHETRLWRRQGQRPDCRSNDLRRALKSFMIFLRESCADRKQFDYDFLAGERPWSRLYWKLSEQLCVSQCPAMAF